MKKFLAVLLALAVAGGLFAQEFKFTGQVNSGLWAHFSNKEDADPFLNVMGPDGQPLRINFTGTYTNADGNAGFVFNLRGQAKNKADGNNAKPMADPVYSGANETLFFEQARAWVKGFDNKVTLHGGYWDPGTYETPGGLGSDLGSDGAGLMLEVNPMDGLVFALAGYTKAADTALLGEAKYILSAAYEMPDTFKVIANFALHQYGRTGFTKDDANTGYTYVDDQGVTKTTYDEQAAKDQRLNLGFNYLGLKDAGFTRIGVDVELRDLGGGRKSGKDGKTTVTPLYIGQRVNFVQGDLALEVRFRQALRLADDRDAYAPSLRFNVGGSYALGSIVPKLDILYVSGGAINGGGPIADMRFNESFVSGWDSCVKDAAGLQIRPAVEFRFGGTANVVEIGYSLKADLTKDTKATAVNSTLDHAVYTTIKASL